MYSQLFELEHEIQSVQISLTSMLLRVLSQCQFHKVACVFVKHRCLRVWDSSLAGHRPGFQMRSDDEFKQCGVVLVEARSRQHELETTFVDNSVVTI